jgi:hypothetical protein
MPELVALAAQRDFDLARDPLLSARLFVQSEEVSILALFLHPMISDSWSSRIFLDELAKLYQAFSTGNVPELSTLPLQYADLAVEQRKWMKSENAQRQLHYWQPLAVLLIAGCMHPVDSPDK